MLTAGLRDAPPPRFTPMGKPKNSKTRIGLTGGNMSEVHLRVPLKEEETRKLRIGDIVRFSGEAWTCRSRLQRYVFDEGHPLPFPTKERNLLIHVGPVIIKENGKWKLVSFMPTSSIRFEKWGARSVKELGLKAIVGKTTMGPATMKAMKENGCIHATPLGVTPNLFLDQITIKDVFWYKELGSIEAAWILELNELGPFLVDIDSEGRNHFDELDMVIARNKKKAYEYLTIPEDFEYTKLY
jgi:tartrate/fumarate subfamily iron-sulfur-dependent hydro-lyase beta chain